MKSIIIEGVNGSGKSTLAEYLGKKYGMKVYHAGTVPTDTTHMLLRIMRDNMRDEDCILDRHCLISELVYSNVLSSSHRIVLTDMAKLLGNKFDVIYCTGEGEPQVKDYYTENHINDLQRFGDLYRNRYVELMKHIKHTVYNFNEEI